MIIKNIVTHPDTLAYRHFPDMIPHVEKLVGVRVLIRILDFGEFPTMRGWEGITVMAERYLRPSDSKEVYLVPTKELQKAGAPATGNESYPFFKPRIEEVYKERKL